MTSSTSFAIGIHRIKWDNTILVSKIKKHIYSSTWKLLFSFTVISDAYRSSMPNESTFTKYWLSQLISKLPELWNPLSKAVPGVVGIINATVYNTKSIVTGPDYGKVCQLLTLQFSNISGAPMMTSNGNIARGIHRSPVNSPHKGQWRGALMFSLICVWINGRVNNGEAGDLRRYRSHYDVTVMHHCCSCIITPE